MTLSKKTYLIVCVVFVGLIAVLSFFTSNILWEGFDVIENNSMRNHVKRIINMIDYEYETLVTTAGDYAGWDETYAFVQNRNKRYIKVNVDVSIFSQLRLNVIIILNRKGEVVYSTGYDRRENKLIPVSPEIMEHLHNGSFLASHENIKSSKKGILPLKKGGVIIASHPILTSTFSGPIMGTLIMGRNLDEEILRRWAKLTRTTLFLRTLQDNKEDLPEPSEIAIKHVSSDMNEGCTLIPDIYGKPAYLLCVRMPRQIHLQAEKTIRYLAIITSILFLAFALAIIWLLKKSIITRLVRIGQDVNRIGMDADFSARIRVDGRDELTRLGSEINGMIEKLEESTRQLKDAHNKLYHTNQVLLEQVEEKKQSETALRNSEERFRSMIQSLTDMIFILDRNGQLTYESPSASRILGYKSGYFIGKSPFTNVHPDDLDQIIKAMEEVVQSINPGIPTQFRYRKADETWCYLEALGSNQFENASIQGIVLTVRDITERKRAEEALRESEKKYRLVLEANPDPMIVYDIEGKVVYFNPAFAGVFGWSLEERIGKKMDDFVPDESWPETRNMIDMVVAGKNFYGIETRRLTRERKIIPVSISGSCYRNKEGNVEATVINLRDITEIKRVEAEKKKLEEQYRQAQKMEAIGQLAGGIAHDFNNMLNIVLGYSQMALTKIEPSDPLNEDLQDIISAARRSADLVRQLLAFARKQTIAPRVLDLNDTVAGMLNMLRKLIGENIDLRWMPAANLWPVKMDPAQVDQIMANLAINARDSISKVGKITIETGNTEINDSYCANHPGFVPGYYAILAFSDSGCGMDKETLGKIYEPFFTTKDFGKGTGLGLATVYGIVKQNNGFINVYSEPGKGTTFRIYLPRNIDDVMAIDEPRTRTKLLTGTETVLLVEDEESLLELTKIMLEQLGYKVLTAGNPSYAIYLAEEQNVDIHLAVIDVVMPEMSGWDLKQRLSTLRPGMKYLFISGYTANVIAHRGILDEGVNFLQKPFIMNDLAAKVREALGK